MANAGSFVKGQKRPNQGKRGPDKIPADIRAMVLNALSQAGGEAYLLKQANQRNPAPFLALVGKCIPKEVKLDANVTLTDLLRQAEERRRKQAGA